MNTLKGELVYLRALEPEDLEFLYQVENNENVWHLSHTQTPYSLFVLKQYIKNAKADIYEAGQLRLTICTNQNLKPVGFIDLFDFDPKNKRAGVGILVYDKKDRNRGYGKEALMLLIKYAFLHLNLHQLYASIETDNISSISLFTNYGFECTGVRKEWNFQYGKWKDEGFYQLLNHL